MNWLNRKWKAWRDSRKAELNRRGYDYAAGQLLIHKGDQQTIERLEAESFGTFDFNEFDRGIQDALLDWRQQHPIVTELTINELRDWVYASWGKKAPGVNTSNKTALAAFAAQVGYDPDAVEAEFKADRQERNQAEQQLDSDWQKAQDYVVTQAIVDHATAPLAADKGAA